MIIEIKELIGSRCIIQEDGQRIFDAIHEPLKKGESVILNFEGVNQFASPFFNFAIGQLLKDIKEEELSRFLKLEGLNETGSMVVEQVIQNAAKYHENKDYQKIVDEILEQQDKDSE